VTSCRSPNQAAHPSRRSSVWRMEVIRRRPGDGCCCRRPAMVTRESFIASLRNATDVNDHYAFIDARGGLDTLRELYTEIGAKCGFGGRAPFVSARRLAIAPAAAQSSHNSATRLRSRYGRPRSASVLARGVIADQAPVVHGDHMPLASSHPQTSTCVLRNHPLPTTARTSLPRVTSSAA